MSFADGTSVSVEKSDEAAPCAKCGEMETELERLRAEEKRWRGAFHATKGEVLQRIAKLSADQATAQRHLGKAWFQIASVANKCNGSGWVGEEHRELRVAIGAASRTVLAGMFDRPEFRTWLEEGLGQE